MPEPQYAPNHTLDTKTGYVQSLAYAHSFDGERKEAFLKLFRENGLALYRTCRQLGMSVSTIHHHKNIDPKFRADLQEVEREYIDELESTSRTNALNPKMIIERIFQLKALLPNKYGEAKSSGSTMINLVFDGNPKNVLKNRSDIIEGKLVSNEPSPTHGDGSSQLPDKSIDGDRA